MTVVPDEKVDRHQRHQKRRAVFLVLVLPYLLMPLAISQTPSASVKMSRGVIAENAIAPSAVAENNAPPPAAGQLELVVALFRHGIRSPLDDMDSKHSGKAWPNQQDWGVPWGDLTEQGAKAATALGAYYGTYYSHDWPAGFRAVFWADVDDRTVATAGALREGLKSKGVPAVVKSVPIAFDQKVDLLFHPFKAACGVPDDQKLNGIADRLNEESTIWLKKREISKELRNLYAVLACNTAQPSKDPNACQPLYKEVDKASAWKRGDQRLSSPIQWTGQFSFASTATEVFLLEYADAMPAEQVGWGRVGVGSVGPGRHDLSEMLFLHEFYFQQTDRDPYLAQIGGSNLLRELLDQINKKAGYTSPVDGQCPRPTDDSQFIGFVGHDTNLANLNALLGIGWDFNDPKLPPSLRKIPANDALPAGALVFELRKGVGNPANDRVSIEYVAQSLDEMKNAPEKSEPAPFHIRTSCRDDANRPLSPCKMSLQSFNNVVQKAIGPQNRFLSRCEEGKQTCP